MKRYSFLSLALGAMMLATAPSPAAAEPPPADDRPDDRDRDRDRRPGPHDDVVIIEDVDGAGDGIEVIIESEARANGSVLVERVRPPVPPAHPPTPPVVRGHGRGYNWFGPPGGAGSQAVKNTLSTSRRVKGPVSIEVGVVQGEIEIVRGAPNVIKVDAKKAAAKNLAIDGRGPRYEINFDGSDMLRRGDIRVELPPGSSVEVEAVNGTVTIKGVGGDVEVEVVSGNVTVEDANRVEVEAVSGDVRVERARSAVSVQTVSGSSRVSTAGKEPPRFEFSTTSGDLDWFGTCGRGCRMELESLSGRIALHLGAASAFEVEFESFSGSLKEKVGLKIVNQNANRYGPGRSYRASLGGGEGRIEAETHSGDLVLEKK